VGTETAQKIIVIYHYIVYTRESLFLSSVGVHKGGFVLELGLKDKRMAIVSLAKVWEIAMKVSEIARWCMVESGLCVTLRSHTVHVHQGGAY
jgi:hypothetical protein